MLRICGEQGFEISELTDIEDPIELKQLCNVILSTVYSPPPRVRAHARARVWTVRKHNLSLH